MQTAIRWMASSASWAAVLLAAPKVFLCFPLLHLQVRFAMALKVMDTACTHFSSVMIWSQAPKPSHKSIALQYE